MTLKLSNYTRLKLFKTIKYLFNLITLDRLVLIAILIKVYLW